MSKKNIPADARTTLIPGEGIILNGRPVRRWEARRDTADGRSTFTVAHFTAPERATRAAVIEAFELRREVLAPVDGD